MCQLKAVVYAKDEIYKSAEEYAFFQKSVEHFLTVELQEPVDCAVTASVLQELECEGILAKEILCIVAEEATRRAWQEADEEIAMVLFENPAAKEAAKDTRCTLLLGFEEMDAREYEKIYQRQHGLGWTIMETERLLIRELELKDLPALFELYEQPGFAKYMDDLYPMEEERAYQEAYIKNMYGFYGYGMWLLWDKKTGELVGRAGLEHRDYAPESDEPQWELEMGYAIRPSRQREGLATEACTAIYAFSKENLEYDRVNCLIAKENSASIAFIKEMGFTFLEETDVAGSPMLRYVKCD